MNLREWRHSKKLSAAEFSKLTNIPIATIYCYENGSRKPRSEVARRIEAATNGEVTAAELLGLPPSSVSEGPRDFEHASTLQVDIGEEDLNDAAKFGLDAAAIARAAVEETVKAARLKAWVAENRSAFDAHAKDIEDNGLWSDGLRMF